MQPLDTAKLTGFVSAVAEAGVALKTETFDGLTEIPAVSLPDAATLSGAAGALAFKFITTDSAAAPAWKLAVTTESVEPWVREMIREAAAAALARSGFGEDPRVRGAAHSAATAVSTFLRSELATQPLIKSGGTWVLHPQAVPPTIFSVALLAQLPAVQRERAGLVERLGAYLAQPAGKKAFGVQCGKKVLRQTVILLGDPLKVSASGQTDDLPFGLYWMELLARLGLLRSSTSVPKLWTRLVKDCDEEGVWRPRNLRALPKRVSPWSYHAFPLEGEGRGEGARSMA